MSPRVAHSPTSTSQALSTLRTGASVPTARCPAWRYMPASPDRALALVFGLVFGEAAGRPVGLGRVAATGTVQRGDVLEGDQDVAVELDMGDVVDRAVRGEHAFLVVA